MIYPMLCRCVVAFCGIVLSGSAFADCATRHFYNNSTVSWTLTMGPGSGSCSIGSIDKADQCVIPSHAVADVHYANTSVASVITAVTALASAAQSANKTEAAEKAALAAYKAATPGGTIGIASDDGKIYSPTSFGVNTMSCRIDHRGNTGNIVLNDPANGDVVTCGRSGPSGYDCRM